MYVNSNNPIFHHIPDKNILDKASYVMNLKQTNFGSVRQRGPHDRAK